jgi:hypothetical protein
MMALGASVVGGLLPGNPGRPGPGGGLPLGVVEWSKKDDNQIKVLWCGTNTSWTAREFRNSEVDLLVTGALTFCLKDSISAGGKVCPFSQISMSFLIFSYTGWVR